MKVTLLAVVIVAAVASLAGAADPECLYRKIRGLSPHWPNPSDCASYYRCSNKNVMKAITCPAGKEYNPKTGKCSTAGRGLCKLSLAAPLSEVTNVCSNEVTGAWVQNVDFCVEYFICDRSLAYPQTCPVGAYFNANFNRCEPDTENECWQNYCLKQPDDSVVASSTSCASYYRCKNEEAILETCPSGYYFDTTDQECVPDEGGSNCWENLCIGKADGSYTGDPKNCNIFYICNKDKPIPQECSAGSYFDQEGSHCIPGTCPDNDTTTTTTTTTTAPPTESPPTGCDCDDNVADGEMVKNPDNCRLYFICENGVMKSGDCQRGNYFDTKSLSCQLDEDKICPESSMPDCVNGDKAKDEENCNQYFSCQNGVWESETCKTGFYYDPECSSCVEDTDNVCPQCKTTSDSAPTVTSILIELPSAPCQVSDPIQRSSNCYSYYVCISGSWKEQSCPAGAYFNANMGICQIDKDNKCPENQIMHLPGLRSKRSVEQEAETNCTCPDGSKEGDIIPHPTDCDKYLICENQQLVDGTCGVGNIFCSSQGICVPDTEATCWVCANKPNGYQMINPADCTSYITCNNGLAETKTCPAGEWYSGSICEIDVTGQCINPCSCGTGNVPHPVCTKYFQCTDGVPQVVDCPVNQAYDSTTEKCSTKVTCNATRCATADDGTIIPIEGEDNKFYICYDHEATIRACPVNTALDPTYLICLPVPSPCSCDQSKCDSNNLYASYPTLNDDNSTFCYCQADGAYVKSCPNGYTYDSFLNICTFTGPCDPQVCVDADEYTPSVNHQDPNSFCLCRAGQQVPVPCPIGYSFNPTLLLCVLIPIPDPRCCRGFCAGKPDDLTFPAIDTDTGFCLCVDEVPSYKDCPPNKIYDTTYNLCLSPPINLNCTCNECNPTECENALEFAVFPVENDNSGFCYCEDYCPVYTKCPNDKVFDAEMLLCLDPPGPVVCDATMCDTYLDNQAYPAENGTDGFCYCDGGMPNYSPCPDGKVFNAIYSMCLEKMTGETSCYCDSEKCSCYQDYQPFPSTNADDDTSFCFCNGGTAYYDNCPNDKYFNVDVALCLTRSASECVCEPGKCASLQPNANYAALNTTSGFCQCVEGAVVYEACPAGKEYNAQYSLCLASPKTKQYLCDATKCQNLPVLSTFALSDTSSGFCVCESDGTASYADCPNGHMYDAILGSCFVDVCDPQQCRSRVQFEAFSARNTTRGFCACDIIPTYYHCTAGHVFDGKLGLCVDEVTARVAACDPRECRGRLQNQPFEAKNTSEGFCSCDGEAEVVTYHKCTNGMLFDRVLNMCLSSTHVIQKRSVEPEEKFACDVNEKRSLPANCSQYEICVEGSWRRRTCSDERYYNPEQQRCLEPRDDMVCSYARVPGLPECNARSEFETIPSRNGKNSCLQYFRCYAGRWRLRSCPKRHYYAANVNTCLPVPTNVVDDLCSWLNRTEISTECVHLAARPAPRSCSTFLMCTENAWWIQQCPLGMYFSRAHNYCLPNDANQCPLEGNTTCTEGQTRGISSSCRSYELCVGGKWSNRTCNPLEQFEPQLGCIPNDGSCHGNGFRRSCMPGELRSVSTSDSNCSQVFYYCESDEWQTASCLRGHSFDRELKKCLSQDKCQVLLKDQSSLPSCLGQPDGQSVPHPDDCTRFYLCLNEQPALPQNCAPGSFFDAILSYCRPNDGSCQQIESICANKTLDALVPHLHNCRAYYNCSNYDQNMTQLLYCPKGQYFDSSQLQCRLDLGQCKQQVMSDPETSLGLCTGVAHGSHLPHKLYCNLYYVCVRGLAISVQCEENKRFNATLGYCTPELESDLECQHGQLDDNVTNSAVYSCDTLQDGSYVPDYRDCTRYYICAGGVALTQRCSVGAYFDAEQLLCLPDDGHCPYVGINTNGDEIANATNSRDRAPNPLLCEGKHGFIIADTSNCNNFYICISNKLRYDRCYDGYHFNSTLLQCQNSELPPEDEKDLQTEAKSELSTLSHVTEQTPVEKQTQTSEKCSDAPTDFSNLCEIISERSSVAEPGDCRRYISCDQNEPVSQRCRNGESFDSLLGICRQNDGTCLMENGERVGVCSGKHGQLARDIHNCRGYFLCVHGQKIEAECDQGYYFNRATNTCQPDELQQCNNNSSEMAKPKIDE